MGLFRDTRGHGVKNEGTNDPTSSPGTFVILGQQMALGTRLQMIILIFTLENLIHSKATIDKCHLYLNDGFWTFFNFRRFQGVFFKIRVERSFGPF